jgi:hypothetical protein
MSDRRLIYYSDARHYHMYCYDPPMRIEDARAPVDEIAGTGIDTFVYGFGLGPNVFHLTEVGEILGTRHETFKDYAPNMPALPFWRTYENIMSLKERGLDILDVLIDRAHEKGLEFFGSFRLSHPNDPKNVDAFDTWQFRIDHPEWCLRGRGRYNFNWIHPEVRAERFAIIEEAVNRYDMDGFELDLAFSPFFFEEGETEVNSHILTDYIREVRGLVRGAARRRGRPMVLGARVLPVLSSNLALGMNVPDWLNEGLLDYVVPMVYGAWMQTDADPPFEWLVQTAGRSGCEVYPALQSRIDSELEGRRPTRAASVDNYRAAAAAYWSKGADAIYLPWFDWPIGTEQRQVLCEIADPDLLREKPKHYVMIRRLTEAEEFGYTAQLPLSLTPGLDAPGQTVRLYVADITERVDATLKLRLANSTSHDSMTVSVNGVPLPEELCRRTSHGFEYYWLEYPLPDGALHNGRNQVGVALHSRPRNLEEQVVLESVELVVSYPGPAAA